MKLFLHWMKKLPLESTPTIPASLNNLHTCIGYSSCECGCQQSCVVDDTKKDYKPTKISINCPKCTIKLGFRVAPSQQKLSSANIALDHGSGDNEEMLRRRSLNKHSARNTQNMSYTVLKGSVSLPDTSILTTTSDIRNVRSRGSKLEVDKIPLKTGKTYDCLQTSQEGNETWACPVQSKCASPSTAPTSSILHDIRTQKSPHSNQRHCSFADPIVSNIDSISSFKSPRLNESQEDISYPFLQTSTGRSLRFVDPSEHLFERDSLLGSGIDLEDGVPLYESSSGSSFCDQDTQETEGKSFGNDEKVNSSVSHNAPVVESKASTSDSGLIPTKTRPTEDGNQMIRVGDHLSPEEIDALNTDIPEHRQDLYKDCFTLFVEQWFGKRGDK